LAEAAALLAAGGCIGLLAGLLGIGGGVVAVPVLLELLGTDRARAAIGTAHAAVLLAALPAIRTHARAGRIGWPLLRAWLPAMLAGTFAGLLVARFAPPTLLVGAFALTAVVLAATLLRDAPAAISAGPPPRGVVGPFLIGLLATAAGVGAGTLSGPVLALHGVPMLGAIGAGSAFNLAVATPALLSFALAGEVAWGALPMLVAPAFLVAPWAARLATRLPARLLRRIFALVLLAIAARMAWRIAA
jgi:uncharacterized membrane protein YfcA